MQAIQGGGLPYVFTDGHATMWMSDFYDDPSRLDQVDWPLMMSRYWFDTEQYPDRKRRRQAEFLVHRFFPWELVAEIGVMNEEMRGRTEAALEGAGYRPVVKVRRQWYY